MRSGRLVCQAAKARMMVAVEVKATCETVANQPDSGSSCRRMIGDMPNEKMN